jgi:ribosomal protein L28
MMAILARHSLSILTGSTRNRANAASRSDNISGRFWSPTIAAAAATIRFDLSRNALRKAAATSGVGCWSRRRRIDESLSSTESRLAMLELAPRSPPIYAHSAYGFTPGTW